MWNERTFNKLYHKLEGLSHATKNKDIENIEIQNLYIIISETISALQEIIRNIHIKT